MGFLYQRLPENQRSRRGGGIPARVWVVSSQRRRWAHVRKITWAVLRGRTSRAAHTPASYDSTSYALNFDDGVWKAEDEGFLRSASFAYRFARQLVN